VVDANADLTTAVSFAAALTIPVIASPRLLLDRAVKGSFHVMYDTEVDGGGSVNFDINSIQGAHDGVNYSTVVDFSTTYDGITAAGIGTVTTLTEAQLAFLASCSHIKLDITANTAFGATTSIKVLAFLAITFRNYG